MDTETKVEAVSCLHDNYAWLLTCAQSAVVVDPSEPKPVLEALAESGAGLRAILLTHHHQDHVAGAKALSQTFPGLDLVCSDYDFAHNRVDGAKVGLGDGDRREYNGIKIECLLTPGHTLGACAFYCEQASAVFTGDTLFAGGCGRLFEGSAAQLHQSLEKLAKLPAPTLVCCGHEYTLDNLRFALTVEPDNLELQQRFKEMTARRTQNQVTVPSTLAVELATNPFMRTGVPSVRADSGDGNWSDAQVFAYLRRQKDAF